MADPLREKIEELKEKYGSEEDLEIIRNWEEKVKKLAMKEDYIKMKPTQDLIELCVKKVETINNILLKNEELDKLERKALFHEREVWEKLLFLYDEEKVEERKEQFNRDLDKKL